MTSTGWLLTIAGTAIPIGIAMRKINNDGIWLGLLGIGVGPSVGNLYASDLRRGLTGLGLRMVGGLVTALGLAQAMEGKEGGEALLLTGSGIIIGSALWNLGTIGKSVREFNERHHGVAITPYLDPVNKAGGVEFALKF
jgi:hypothetical protein